MLTIIYNSQLLTWYSMVIVEFFLYVDVFTTFHKVSTVKYSKSGTFVPILSPFISKIDGLFNRKTYTYSW
jgi:hypothetical protein